MCGAWRLFDSGMRTWHSNRSRRASYATPSPLATLSGDRDNFRETRLRPRYDHPLPQVLSSEEVDGFLGHLDATQYRDTAIAWLLKDGGLRINEALQLRLSEINWGQRIL